MPVRACPDNQIKPADQTLRPWSPVFAAPRGKRLRGRQTADRKNKSRFAAPPNKALCRMHNRLGAHRVYSNCPLYEYMICLSPCFASIG
jgi:hypothetical protein